MRSTCQTSYSILVNIALLGKSTAIVLSVPITKLPKMTTLKNSLPIYQRNKWATLEVTGDLQVSTDSDSDTLSQYYEKLKPPIAELLLQIQSENQIVVDIQQTQAVLSDKSATLRILSNKITRANKQLERLIFFTKEGN